MASLRKYVKDGDYYSYNDINLSSVTSATIGSTVDVSRLRTQTMFFQVTGNTGAVTVSIEVSPNQSSWSEVSTDTYTATNINDSVTIDYGVPFIRTRTSTQANATVTTRIYGRN